MSEARILVVDDDPDYLDIITVALTEAGYRRITAETDALKAAARIDAGEAFELALLDLTMPEMDGMELLECIKHAIPMAECILVTANNEALTAVACLKKGAYDYLVKPVPAEKLVATVQRALERKRLLDLLDLGKGPNKLQLQRAGAFRPILTRAPAMLRLLKEAELHAASDVPVLITGESGTGKDLLAAAIHRASPRSGRPYTAVNMASLNTSLFDAEFFGHSRGAFTGAEKDRTGYLEYSVGGTLFLDEIGILPLELQGKLLRVLQDGEYVKLGTNRRRKADVRFIAATNEDLDRLISRGRFRKDLFYRLRGGWLHLPPLRQRPEDIPMLAQHFLRHWCPNSVCHLAPSALEALCRYPFPGNVRELQSMIQSAANLAQGRTVDKAHLPATLRSVKGPANGLATADGESFAPLATVEKSHILKVYKALGRNKARTAATLGLGLNTLRRKLAKYNAD